MRNTPRAIPIPSCRSLTGLTIWNPGDVSCCDNLFFYRTWLQYMNSKHIKKQLSDLSITEDMHRHGINMRHLGRVRCLITEEGLRRLLLTEMVARFAKQTLRGRLRKNKPQASSATLEKGEPIYAGEPMSAVSIVVDLFNEIIGAPTRTQEGRKRWVFWDQVRTHPLPFVFLHTYILTSPSCAQGWKQKLCKKFFCALSVEEIDSNYPLIDAVDMKGVFTRLCTMCGIITSKARLFPIPLSR